MNHKNILTIEDPIEYELRGIGQTQVNPKTTTLLGIEPLRQDPDIILVGKPVDGNRKSTSIPYGSLGSQQSIQTMLQPPLQD